MSLLDRLPPPRPTFATPPRADVVTALVLLVVGIAEHALADPAAAVALVPLLASVPIAWRRVTPVATCLAVIACIGVPAYAEAGASDWSTSFLVVVLAIYTLAASTPARRIVPATLISAALLASVAAAAGVLDNTETDGDAIVNGALFAVVILYAPAYLVGLAARRHADLRRRLEEQAAALETERERHAEAAAAGERSRVADELHDVVAAGVEAMLASLVDARAAVIASPSSAAPAIQRVEDRGREALAEMRELLGVLRRGDEDLALAPMPSLARLEALTQRRSCTLRVEGPPRAVSPGLDVAAFRVVETALDRASTAEHTDVVLRWTPRAVELEVGADGVELADAARDLRELVSLFDGRVEVARRADGGSAVRAALPTEVRA